MLRTLIKGRYAAFFLSLQSYQHRSVKFELKVLNLKNFEFNFPARCTDNHHIVLLFTD